jgi:hypothetical protein
MPHLVTFESLRPEPLASYTAALGVLRLVAEQVDPKAQGWWHNDRFRLQSKLDQGALLRFFLQDYHPTPMASPWNAGGGFYGRSADSAITQIERSDDPRFAAYRGTLTVIDGILKARKLEDRPATPSLKRALLNDLHANLPPEAQRYMDAVLSWEDDEPSYHSLFFAGGNDGRLDFAKNFMERLSRLLLDPAPESQSLLQAALFDTLTGHLKPESAGPHDPTASGGPYASSEEFDAEPLSNPWTYILGMEGTLLITGGCGQSPHISAGYPSAAPKETWLRDLWLPRWTTPRTVSQLRKELAAEPDRHHLRYSFLPRNGRCHFAVPVQQRAEPLHRRPGYVKDLEKWLGQDSSPELQEAFLAEPVNAARILEAVGALGLHKKEKPLELPKAWIAAADDGTPEFGCALSLSGLGRGESDLNLDFKAQIKHFVGPDLCARMLSLLRLRIRRANQVSKLPTLGGYPRFNAPFWSTHPTRPRHIEAFLAQPLDEDRVQRLFYGLCLVDAPSDQTEAESAFLPYPFAIAKLAFHQYQYKDRRPVPVEVADALATNQPDLALARAVRFLELRHPGFPQDWPPCPPQDPRTCRRWAAALLFPISDATYQAILGEYCAH